MIRGNNHLVLDTGRDDYGDLLHWVRDHGRPVTVGASVQYELRDLATTFLDPTDVIPYDIGVPISTALWAALALEFISGIATTPLIERITGEERRTDGLGDYVMEQLYDVRDVLFTDPGSRRAVVNTRPAQLQFLFRDEALELHTHTTQDDVMRLPATVFVYTQLQLTMANLLGVRPGAYHHHTAALYLRTGDVGKIDTVHASSVYTRPEDDPLGFGVEARNWEEVADRAEFVARVVLGQIMTGFSKNSFSDAEKWYLTQLRPFYRPAA